MAWVYRRNTEEQTWDIGYFEPSGEFYPIEFATSSEAAGQRVSVLNGGLDLTAIENIAYGLINHAKH